MIRFLSTVCLLLAYTACTFPSKEDLVRENRRKYEISQDFTIDDEARTLAYEIKIKNLAGKLKLQDLTVDITAYSETDEAIWSTRSTLDVSGIPEYSSKTFSFKEELERAPEIQKFLVALAPDDETSDYKNYPEFERIIQ